MEHRNLIVCWRPLAKKSSSLSNLLTRPHIGWDSQVVQLWRKLMDLLMIVLITLWTHWWHSAVQILVLGATLKMTPFVPIIIKLQTKIPLLKTLAAFNQVMSLLQPTSLPLSPLSPLLRLLIQLLVPAPVIYTYMNQNWTARDPPMGADWIEACARS